MAQTEAPLANQWRGLRRDIAPHLLQESESPDCLDCAQYQNKVGILGPRLGRVRQYNTSYNIKGVGGFNFGNVGRGRIIATSDGSWTTTTVSWPNTSAPTNLGWDIISISNLTAAQSGVGTTNGTSKSITSTDLAQYGALAVKLTAGNIKSRVNVSTGTGKLQLKISTVWTDFLTYTISSSGENTALVQATLSLTGSITDCRSVSTISTESGSSSMTVTWYCDIYLIRGTGTGTTITAT